MKNKRKKTALIIELAVLFAIAALILRTTVQKQLTLSGGAGSGNEIIGHEPIAYLQDDGRIYEGKCRRCGEDICLMYDRNSGVKFSAPANTRTKTANVNVINGRGYTYHYKVYRQNTKYETYSSYFPPHGCSTCALTMILNARVDELSDITPDRVIGEIQKSVFGRRAFNRNYSKSLASQMPVTLVGMTKIFDRYGVSYTLPTTDRRKYAEEISEHLKHGDPVIVTFGKGKKYGLSEINHTIVLIGIDADGYVIIGDSAHKSEKDWGKEGLVKTGRLTVENIVDCLETESGWTINDKNADKKKHLFYAGPEDRGYLLIN